MDRKFAGFRPRPFDNLSTLMSLNPLLYKDYRWSRKPAHSSNQTDKPCKTTKCAADIVRQLSVALATVGFWPISDNLTTTNADTTRVVQPSIPHPVVPVAPRPHQHYLAAIAQVRPVQSQLCSACPAGLAAVSDQACASGSLLDGCRH
jgi:hypothetical protein